MVSGGVAKGEGSISPISTGGGSCCRIFPRGHVLHSPQGGMFSNFSGGDYVVQLLQEGSCSPFSSGGGHVLQT